MLREKTCCFTGHRDLCITDQLKERLISEIERLIQNGVLYFGCGGASGFDMLAAQTVVDCKRKYPNIKLILVLPCKDNTKFWGFSDKLSQKSLINKADKIVYTAEKYCPGCMMKRNMHLVNNSAYCICYLNSERGGTANTVNYARKKQIKIINIAE